MVSIINSSSSDVPWRWTLPATGLGLRDLDVRRFSLLLLAGAPRGSPTHTKGFCTGHNAWDENIHRGREKHFVLCAVLLFTAGGGGIYMKFRWETVLMCGGVRIKRLAGKNNGLAGMTPLPHWSIGSEWLIRQPHKGKRGGNTKFSKILSRIPIGLLESDPRKSQP